MDELPSDQFDTGAIDHSIFSISSIQQPLFNLPATPINHLALIRSSTINPQPKEANMKKPLFSVRGMNWSTKKEKQLCCSWIKITCIRSLGLRKRVCTCGYTIRRVVLDTKTKPCGSSAQLTQMIQTLKLTRKREKTIFSIFTFTGIKMGQRIGG